MKEATRDEWPLSQDPRLARVTNASGSPNRKDRVFLFPAIVNGFGK